MKALLISGGTTLIETNWDTQDILNKLSSKEMVERMDFEEKEIRKVEFFHKHRMDLLEH